MTENWSHKSQTELIEYYRVENKWCENLCTHVAETGACFINPCAREKQHAQIYFEVIHF